jgi:hypothetical protein
MAKTTNSAIVDRFREAATILEEQGANPFRVSATSSVWRVVGLQRSVREWAMRQGWGGRFVRIDQAQGILVAALGMLAGHYGFGLRW